MELCTVIFADSGGIQEEALIPSKPVRVTRETTERPEALTVGTTTLVGADRGVVFHEESRLSADSAYYCLMSSAHNSYGDGNATGWIVHGVLNRFQLVHASEKLQQRKP